MHPHVLVACHNGMVGLALMYQVPGILFMHAPGRLLTVYIIVLVRCLLRLAGVRRGEGLLGRRAPRCSARKPSGGVVQAGQGRIFRHFRRQCALTVDSYIWNGRRKVVNCFTSTAAHTDVA